MMVKANADPSAFLSVSTYEGPDTLSLRLIHRLTPEREAELKAELRAKGLSLPPGF